MKRLVNGFPAAVFFSGALLLGSCSDADKDAAGKRIDNMENRVDESVDNTAEWIEFRKEAKAEIAANRAKISELRAEQETAGKLGDKVRQERIEQLQNQNDRLQQDIDQYQPRKGDGNNENWQEFKREFRHDMDELGESIRDIGKNNKN